LVVTGFNIPQVNYSGEAVTIGYTVTNQSQNPVWPGTQYLADFIWLSADPTFIRTRASYLGAATHGFDRPLLPGESYEVSFETTLPAGTDGDYYLHIHMNAQNDFPPGLHPFIARQVLTDAWPYNSGRNDEQLDFFSHWAFEDPHNNLVTRPIPITYREADLEVTEFNVPASLVAGSDATVNFKITNEGGRETRVDSWVDRVFLSRDPSLDDRDLLLANVGHTGALAMCDFYIATANIRIPDGIEGDFYLLVYSDSAANINYLGESDIGFGFLGLSFDPAKGLFPWDLASAVSRGLARGKVEEFQHEGNNIADRLVPVTLPPAPDLQVIAGFRAR
jgi:hypothetical protein